MSSNKQRLLFLGMCLFLLGLISGLVVAQMPNPRMGLSAHLEGLMNGMFLLAAGLAWPRIKLSHIQEKLAFGLLVYGAYANFVIIQTASVLGTSEMTPIAGEGFRATKLAETFVNIGLVTVVIAMVTAVVFMAIGLYRYEEKKELT